MTYSQGATGSAPPKTNISGYKQKQVQQFTPQQLQILEKLFSGLMPGIESGTDFLSRLASGDESLFEELEAPAHRDFQKTLGDIGTRFSHLGAQDSSYFENATAGEGAALAQNLQSQRLGLRQKAIESLIEKATSLLDQRPYTSTFEKKEKKGNPWWKALGTAGGAATGFLLGGPAGAAQGASTGYGLTSQL